MPCKTSSVVICQLTSRLLVSVESALPTACTVTYGQAKDSQHTVTDSGGAVSKAVYQDMMAKSMAAEFCP